MINGYEAIRENPRVFCAYGNTPARALKNMSKLLKENDIEFFSASHVGFIPDEDMHYINIYV